MIGSHNINPFNRKSIVNEAPLFRKERTTCTVVHLGEGDPNLNNIGESGLPNPPDYLCILMMKIFWSYHVNKILMGPTKTGNMVSLGDGLSQQTG